MTEYGTANEMLANVARKNYEPRVEAAFRAGYESMRFDADVWYEALERAIPKILAAADAVDAAAGLAETP